MTKIALLVIHCTATKQGREVYPEEIRAWHTNPVEKGGRGWRRVGYSDMIMTLGTVVNLVPYNDDNIVDPWEITNGVAGINSKSRHIVYVGGLDKNGKPKDTRTPAQLKAMTEYVWSFLRKNPQAKIAGHNQFDKGKACPSFDTVAWLRSIGIPENNIYK